MSQSTIHKSTVGNIRELLFTEQKPLGLLHILLKDIRSGIKFNILTKQKSFLESCLRKGLCPTEIVSIAGRMRERNMMMRNMNLQMRNRIQEKKILKMRVQSATTEARRQKKEWERVSTDVYRMTKMTVHGKIRYKCLKEKELQRAWKDLTDKFENKLDNLRKRQRPNDDDRGIPDRYRGVIVNDEALIEAFGDEKPEPKIYGGIEASENVKAFMILPANLRRYDKVNTFKEEVSAEETATKQRWTIAETEVEGYEELTTEQKKIKIDKDRTDRTCYNTTRVDFGRVRATEMSHNKWITLPKAVNIRSEIKIQSQRLETIDEVKKFVNEMCDDDGVIKEAENLTEAEQAGYKEIQLGIKNAGWMLYTTDKSNSLVLDTQENFLECMNDHFKNDTVVEMKVIERAETDVNNLSRIWANILSLGKDINQGKRCKDTLIVDHPGIPTMQGYRKDHKGHIGGDPKKGPPLRPLCAANKSLNAPLGTLMSKILKAVGDEASATIGTEILSTEELCRAAEELNKQLDDEDDHTAETTNVATTSDEDNTRQSRRVQPQRRCNKTVTAQSSHSSINSSEQRIQSSELLLGSMDAKALFPSVLDIMAGEAAEEMIAKSRLDWNNVDVKSLTRFVALKVPREELVRDKLADVIPKPKTKTTVNSYANPRGTARLTSGENQFEHVRVKPSTNQIKHILGKAVKATIIQCMNNHFYQIGGKVYRQSKGGSIGSSLTGEACRVYMLKWDELFLQKLSYLKIDLKLYKRYVDDISIVLNSINKGWRYDVRTNSMLHTDDIDDRSPQQRTFSILCEIANSINPQIQMTFDVPENHGIKRIPVLDLNMWISENDEGQSRLHHAFYRKQVSSPYTILYRSAISGTVKRNTHYQDALRRMRNCDKTLDWSEKASHLSTWGNMLRISGYSAEYRYRILQGAILRHDQMLEEEKSGLIENFYRNRAQMVAHLLSKGGKASAATWFLKGGVTTTLTTMATPGSNLKNRIQAALKTVQSPDGGTTKVIEASGVPISWGLKKKNPFRQEGCHFSDPKCGVDPKVDCGIMGSCYVITCNDCGESIPEPTPTTVVGHVATQAVVQAGRRRPPNNNNRNSNNNNKTKTNKHNNRPHYIGTSARSMHARMLGHTKDINGKQLSNAMAKHNAQKHPDKTLPPKSTMTLLTTHIANLGRQVGEGLHLEKQNPEMSLNDRMEWSRSRGPVRIYSTTI